MDIVAQLNNDREIRLPPVTEREGAIIAYRVILIRMLRELRAEYRDSILSQYKHHRQFVADESAWFSSLKAKASRLVTDAVDQVSDLLSKEAQSFETRYRQTFKKATKIDIGGTAVTIRGKQARLMQNYVERNASLIQSLSDDTVKRIQQSVYNAKINGDRLDVLSSKIQKDFKILKNRADLIAEDQMASLNSDLTAMQNQSLGIKKYRWRTRRDERVRPRHKKLEGRIYKYGQSTDAEGGLPPGKPIRCRCAQEAIIPPKQNTLTAIALGIAAGLAAVELAAGNSTNEPDN